MNQELIGRDIKEPLCGWQWVYAHFHDLDGWMPTIEFKSPGASYKISVNKPGVIKEVAKILK